MTPYEILTEFGLPVAGLIACGYFIWKQQQWVQLDLKKDLEEQAKRLEEIVIALINAQKKLQTDFGKELARLEGSYRSISNIIQKLSGGLKNKK